MNATRYIRRGSLGHMALGFIQDKGGLVERAEVVAAVAPFTSPAYADEVVTNLLRQGFVRSNLVAITPEGMAALARTQRKEVGHG